PLLDDDVVLRRLQLMSDDLLRLGFNLLHRLDDGRQADSRGTRAVGPHTELHLVGIAMDDRDLLDRDSEAARNHLGEGRLMTLAVAVRTGQDFDGADGIDPHLRGLPETDAGAETADGF